MEEKLPCFWMEKNGSGREIVRLVIIYAGKP
jgi:hypothetical protein